LKKNERRRGTRGCFGGVCRGKFVFWGAEGVLTRGEGKKKYNGRGERGALNVEIPPKVQYTSLGGPKQVGP